MTKPTNHDDAAANADGREAVGGPCAAMPSWFRRLSKKRRNLRRWVLVLAGGLLCGLALHLAWPLIAVAIWGRSVPTLYLIAEDSDGVHFVPAGADTIRNEPNLVIITHGWYEREPWPARMALAIYQRVDHRSWCCGWYDWRGQATRLLPWDASKIARDETGPSLGRQIVGLSEQWRHVHLIGHSSGTWLVNEAAAVVASRTSANLHVTYLDAYVPQGWDPNALGRFASDPCEVFWADHYFTRDWIGDMTANVLTRACNVDITAVNPGFNGHKFPWYWYQATIAGGYDPNGRFARDRVYNEVSGVQYGYERSLEAGRLNWQTSLDLGAAGKAIHVRSSR